MAYDTKKLPAIRQELHSLLPAQAVEQIWEWLPKLEEISDLLQRETPSRRRSRLRALAKLEAATAVLVSGLNPGQPPKMNSVAWEVRQEFAPLLEHRPGRPAFDALLEGLQRLAVATKELKRQERLTRPGRPRAELRDWIDREAVRAFFDHGVPLRGGKGKRGVIADVLDTIYEWCGLGEYTERPPGLRRALKRAATLAAEQD